MPGKQTKPKPSGARARAAGAGPIPARRKAGCKQPDALTLQEIDFVREYLTNGGNGTEAAIAAGYAPKGAASMAVKLLGRPIIAKELAEIREQAEAKRRRKAVRDVAGIQDYWAAYIMGDVEPSATPADRLRASGLLGKSIGALRDQVTGDLTVRVVYEDEGGGNG